MRVSLPNPGVRYFQEEERARNDAIERAFRDALSNREHIEIVPPRQLILYSPDGTRWKIEVDNSGVVSGTAL